MKKLTLLSLAFALFTLVGISSNQASAGTGCIGTGASCSTTTSVQVDILPGNMCIGSTGTFVFGSFAASSASQTVTGAFVGSGGYFYVDDLRGSNSGYYTTVQLNADLTGPGASTLLRTNIFMKTAAIGNAGITLMAWAANTNVQIQAGMAAYQSLDTARQLIIRNTGANGGLIGQYGVLPQMQLIIPAYQAVGTYTGTLTYTLYTN
jgi:hypothetical protein